jgi:hypothetical protein
MGKEILKDKMLKLIIEDIYVTRAEQISNQLNVDNNIVIALLEEMEKSEHIQLVRSGSKQIYVIIVKPPGRQFYKSAALAQMDKETIKEKKPTVNSSKPNRKTLTWTITAIVLSAVLIMLIIGYMRGWFS